MWTSIVGLESLIERGRWKVEYFCPAEKLANITEWDWLTPVGKLVTERKETIEPASLGEQLVNYVGLEHVQSMTGELADHFGARKAKDVKSRSKVFREDDVLFGRLRPNLNKVIVAKGAIADGICSGEFFVLIPNKQVILPMVLRYLLSSHYVQRHADRLQTGTALPRMNLDDLFAIEVPVPPLNIQHKLERKLEAQFAELVRLRKKVREMPEEILNKFLCEIEESQST